MLSERKALFVIGGSLVVFGVLSFVGVVILRVATGHSLDVLYYTPRLQPVTAISALVAALALAVAIVFLGALRLTYWYRQHRGMARRRDP
jgi:hypothetical protein